MQMTWFLTVAAMLLPSATGKYLMSQYLQNVTRKMFMTSVAEDGSALPAPIRVGTPLTLDTGHSYSNIGREYRRAYTLWTEWVNNVRGGIRVNGLYHPVESMLIDDHQNSTRVTEIAQDLVNSGVKHFWGPYSSGLSGYVARIVNTSGSNALMVAAGASSSSVYINRPNVFGIMAKANSWYSYAISRFSQAGAKTLLAIEEGGFGFTKSLCSQIPQLAAANGITHVATLVFQQTDVVNTWVQNILKPNATADVLLVCSYATLCKNLLQAMKTHAVNFKAMVFSLCVTSSGFLQQLGSTARFALGVVPWMDHFPIDNTLSKFKPSDFTLVYGHFYNGVKPPYQSAAVWASCMAWMWAIEAANSTEPDLVAAKLRTIDVQTLYGRIRFDQNGQAKLDYKLVTFLAASTVPEYVGTNDLMYPIPQWDVRDCFEYSLFMKHSNRGLIGANATATCAVCPAGQTTSWTAAAWHGKFLGWKCLPSACLSGQQNQAGVCSDCPAGWYGTPSLTCIQCAAGKTSTAARSTTCTDCAPGSFANVTGQSFCTLCPLGSEAGTTGSFNCRHCEAGHYAEVMGTVNCNLCPVGRTANISAASYCDLCPAGKYSAWGARICTECAVGKYQGNPGHMQCYICKTGADCSTSGVASPINQPNWWHYYGSDPDFPGEQKSLFAPCDRSGVCIPPNACKEGHIGIECLSCLPDYSFGLAGGVCIKCPKKWLNMSVAIVVCVIICGMSFVVADWAIKGTMQMKSVISALLKLLFNYVTTMTFMAIVLIREYSQRLNDLAVRYPDQLDGAQKDSRMAKFFSVDLSMFFSSFFSLECLIAPPLSQDEKNDIYDLATQGHLGYINATNSGTIEKLERHHKILEGYRLLIWAVIPALLTCSLFVFGFIALKIHSHRNKEFYAQAAAFIKDMKANGWSSAKERTGPKEAHEYMKAYNYRLFGIWRVMFLAPLRGSEWRTAFLHQGEPLITVINFVLFPYVIRAFLRPLSCIEPGDKHFGRRIEDNPDVKCYNSDLLFWSSSVLLGTYGIGLPCLAFFLLWENAEKLDKDRYKRTYGFLISGYEVDRRWWECFVLLRKTVSAAIASLGMDLYARIFLMMCASLVFFFAHVFYEPFDNRFKELLDRIERRHLIAWCTWSVLILTMHMLPEDASRTHLLILLILMMMVHVWFFLMIIKHIVRHIRNGICDGWMLRTHRAQHREVMHLFRTGEVDEDKIVMKRLPPDCLEDLKSCSHFVFKFYVMYLNKLSYVCVNPCSMQITLFGGNGATCIPPPELNEDWFQQASVEPETFAAAKALSDDEASYFLDVIGEAFEYVIVNKEINHFSCTAFEFFMRAAFAISGDGCLRTVTVSHHHRPPGNEQDDEGGLHGALKQGLQGLQTASTAVAAISKRTVNSIHSRKTIGGSATEASSPGKTPASTQPSRHSIRSSSTDSTMSNEFGWNRSEEDVAPRGTTGSKFEDEVAGFSQQINAEFNDDSGERRPSVADSTPGHNTLAAIQQMAAHDRKQQRAANLKKCKDAVVHMNLFGVYLRGITIQDMQLNLAASLHTRDKDTVMKWMDIFENDYETRQRESAHMTVQKYLLLDASAGLSIAEVPPKEGFEHNQVLVRPEDIDLHVAVGDLNFEIHRKHGWAASGKGAAHLEQGVANVAHLADLMRGTDTFQQVLEDTKDAGDNIYIVAWSRFVRSKLIKLHQAWNKNPKTEQVDSLKRKRIRAGEFMTMRKLELAHAEEELIQAREQAQRFRTQDEKTARDLMEDLKQAKAEHAGICKELLSWRHKIEALKAKQQGLPTPQFTPLPSAKDATAAKYSIPRLAVSQPEQGLRPLTPDPPGGAPVTLALPSNRSANIPDDYPRTADIPEEYQPERGVSASNIPSSQISSQIGGRNGLLFAPPRTPNIDPFKE